MAESPPLPQKEWEGETGLVEVSSLPKKSHLFQGPTFVFLGQQVGMRKMGGFSVQLPRSVNTHLVQVGQSPSLPIFKQAVEIALAPCDFAKIYLPGLVLSSCCLSLHDWLIYIFMLPPYAAICSVLQL